MNPLTTKIGIGALIVVLGSGAVLLNQSPGRKDRRTLNAHYRSAGHLRFIRPHGTSHIPMRSKSTARNAVEMQQVCGGGGLSKHSCRRRAISAIPAGILGFRYAETQSHKSVR